MEREGSLAWKSAILGPVIGIVDQFRSGDRRGVLRTMEEFLEGKGESPLETGYRQWREGLSPQIAQIITDEIQKDPKKENNLRGLYLDSALTHLEHLRQVKEKTI